MTRSSRRGSPTAHLLASPMKAGLEVPLPGAWIRLSEMRSYTPNCGGWKRYGGTANLEESM